MQRYRTLWPPLRRAAVPRFRLRTALTVVALFAVAICLPAKRALDNQRAVEVLRKYGCHCGPEAQPAIASYMPRRVAGLFWPDFRTTTTQFDSHRLARFVQDNGMASAAEFKDANLRELCRAARPLRR